MRRRNVILGLAAVAALAVAIPATGADNKLKNALGIAKKADKRSKRALKFAQIPILERARATGSFTTGSTDDYVAAPDGPGVKVTVPKSGMIEVIAAADVGEDAGAVSLYEDGQRVPDQSDLCTFPLTGLFASPDGVPGRYGTPAAVGLVACAANGAPSSVFFNRSPGEHTYELRYLACGCTNPTATFTNRVLWVAPRP